LPLALLPWLLPAPLAEEPLPDEPLPLLVLVPVAAGAAGWALAVLGAGSAGSSSKLQDAGRQTPTAAASQQHAHEGHNMAPPNARCAVPT
jgi:hypothetical protein